MMTPDAPAPANKRLPWLFLGLILVVSAGLLILADRTEPPTAVPIDEPTPKSYSKYAQALSDSAPVIGVALHGHYRAYPLSLLLAPTEHAQNHLMDGDAVTVTFCDLDNCVRVFHEPNRNEPLAITVDGDSRRSRKMVLKINKVAYWQDNGKPVEDSTTAPFPYQQLESTQTTWGEWRRLHPETERYVGKGEFLPAGK